MLSYFPSLVVRISVAAVPVAYNTVQPVLATVLPSSSSTAQKEGQLNMFITATTSKVASKSVRYAKAKSAVA